MCKTNEQYNTIIEGFYERHYKDLFRFAISFLKDTQDAEDAVQECFVAIMRKPERYRQIRDIRHYLYRMVQNRCLLVLKNKKSLSVKQEDFNYYQYSSSAPDIYAVPDREESKFTLEWFFSFLTPQRKKVIELVYLEQKSYMQAASILGISKESIKTHLRLAKSKIKEQRAILITGILVFISCFSSFRL